MRTHALAATQIISKLSFLSETNILSNMAALATWMLAAIVWIVTLGGRCLSQKNVVGVTLTRP